MKITKICKYISVVTMFAFIATQVVPVGLAIDPGTLSKKADTEQVLTKAVGDTADPSADTAKTTVTPVAAAASAGTVGFLMGTLPAPSVVSSNATEAVKSAPASTVAAVNAEVASAGAGAQAAGSTTQTTTANTQTTDLPVAPPLGLTNEDQPATLFYTVAERQETLNDWRGGLAIPRATPTFLDLLADVMTSIRKFASDVWTAFKNSVTSIIVQPLREGLFGQADGENNGKIRLNSIYVDDLFMKDRGTLFFLLLHESFHRIGGAIDVSMGFKSNMGSSSSDQLTSERALKAQDIIATNSSNGRGWREILGDEWSLEHFHSSLTKKDEVYTISTDPKTGERTVARYSYGDLDWYWSQPLVGGTQQPNIKDNLIFSGQSEVYRADNTLARIIQYEQSGRGVRPDGTNKIASITYYDTAGTAVVSRAEYTAYAAGDRYQVTLKNAAGEVLSAKWYQTVNGKPVELPEGWNLPTGIIATAPTSAGYVTVSGTRAANTSIWYSLDGGLTYKQLVVAGSNAAWSGRITLPAGTSTISVISRTTVTSAGVSTTLASELVVLAPITYAAPTVPVPTNVVVTVPTSAGVVTVSGTRAANTSIWYSLDGGLTYKQLIASGSSTSWTGNITLPVGTSTLSVISKTTAVVSGVSTVISSAAVVLAPVTRMAPAPVVTALPATTGTNPFVLKGTKAAGESIWISADGGLTYTLLVADNTSTSWSASQPLAVGANNFKIVAKDASLNPSAIVTLPTITYDPFYVSDQPPLRYTQDQRNATANEWSAASGGRIVGVDSNVAQIILDVLTTLRLSVPDYWRQFKSRIFQIQNGATTQGSDVGAAAQVSRDGTNGYFILGPAFFAKNANGSVDQTRIADKRFDLLEHIIHESYHVIGNRVDAQIGMASTDLLVEVNEQPNERFADWRAMKTIQAIAKNGGWDEVYGNNEYHFTSNNEAYQIVYSQSDPTHYTKVYYRFGDLNFDAARFWKSGLTATQRQTIKNTFWCYYPSRHAYYLNLSAFFATGRTVTGSEICHV